MPHATATTPAEPRRRWASRVDMLADIIPPNATTAEIGIDRGMFSREILAHRPRRHWAVDPYVGTVWQLGRLVTPGERLDAARRVLAVDPRVAWAFCRSAAWWPTLAAGELDMVYLDGAHDRDSVAADLVGAMRAVRPGGWIAGHDWTNDDRVLPGVRAAVASLAAELGLELFLTAEPPGPVWFDNHLAPFRVAYDSWAFQNPGPPESLAASLGPESRRGRT